MSSLSPLGTRGYQNTALAGATQQPARGSNAAQQAAASKASSNVALSSGAVDLQQRVDSLGNDTIDLAQNLLGSFAQRLLGDSARGATIAFDSVALEASSSMAAGTLRSEGADGVSSASGFSLNESSHFLGKGTITLADGTKYDFEVEVQYEASMFAGYAGSEEAGQQKPSGQNLALPSFDFPEIDWPGGLGDLFKLMDKRISGDVKDGQSGDVLGNLSVRLMQLVRNTQSLDTYAPPSPVKAYVAEATAAAAEDAKAAAEADLETDKSPMPIKVPQDVATTSSATGIAPTISTTPPPADEA
ncbi:hypothetical protein GJV26_22830 [Massilia dura]|uniref:Uncharacterized protein n=1 Tax=Pseudoduganella dura TaxID=321982 RepID=A0A6I3XLE7_9BURK|nr:hypothetical protein [Pseudoduganella dura]MUI15273.1 hypothetical protein [Pseudoduganella dura]GGY21579.1 hypothetical protein GCM10007386_57790 [Pseudoduganella dura]